VATLSDRDAFEFVSSTDCDCWGRTTILKAHSYIRPPMGCGVLARTVYIPTLSVIVARPSRSVCAATESGRSPFRSATTFNRGSGFTE